MEIAQITATSPATASVFGENPGVAGTGVPADSFPRRLFASLLAAGASSEGRPVSGTESAEGVSTSEAAIQAESSPTVVGALSCYLKSAVAYEGTHPEESNETLMAERKKYPAGPFPAAEIQAAAEEKAQPPETSGLTEVAGLQFKETGNGVKLAVSLRERNDTVEEKGDVDGKERDEQGLMAAFCVLRDIFRQAAPEADHGAAQLPRMEAGDVTGTIGMETAAEAIPPAISARGTANGMPGQGDYASLEISRDAVADPALPDGTDVPALSGTSSGGPAVKRGELPIMEVVNAAGGESDALAKNSMTASASKASPASPFPKAHRLKDATGTPAPDLRAPEATALERNGMESARVSANAGDPEADLTGNGFSRQEDSGNAVSREIFAKQGSAANFEVVQNAAGGKTDEVKPPVGKGRLDENILNQVREELAASPLEKDKGQVTLKLNPRELGDLMIDIRMENSKVAIDISAQNPVVKEALMQHLDTLKETLTRQNITMERFDVSTGTGHGADQSGRQGRGPAREQGNSASFPAGGSYREETARVKNTDWLPRENALVDMRW